MKIETVYRDRNNQRLDVSQEVKDALADLNLTDKTLVSYENVLGGEAQFVAWAVENYIPGRTLFKEVERRYLDLYLALLTAEKKDTTEVSDQTPSSFDEQIALDALETSDVLNTFDHLEEDTAANESDDIFANAAQVPTQAPIDIYGELLHPQPTKDEADTEDQLSMEELQSYVKSDDSKETVVTKKEMPVSPLLFEKDSDYQEPKGALKVNDYYKYLPQAVTIADVNSHYMLSQKEAGTIRLDLPIFYVHLVESSLLQIYQEDSYFCELTRRSANVVKFQLGQLVLLARSGMITSDLYLASLKAFVLQRLSKSKLLRKKVEALGGIGQLTRVKVDELDLPCDFVFAAYLLKKGRVYALDDHISQDATLRRIDNKQSLMDHLLCTLVAAMPESQQHVLFDDQKGINAVKARMDQLAPDILRSEKTRKRTNQSRRRFK